MDIGGPRQVFFIEPHLYKQCEWNLKKVQLVETERAKVLAGSWGWRSGNREKLVKGTDFQL